MLLDDYSSILQQPRIFSWPGNPQRRPVSRVPVRPYASVAPPRFPTGMKKGSLKREPRKGGCRRLLLRHYYEKVYLKSISWLLCF